MNSGGPGEQVDLLDQPQKSAANRVAAAPVTAARTPPSSTLASATASVTAATAAVEAVVRNRAGADEAVPAERIVEHLCDRVSGIQRVLQGREAERDAAARPGRAGAEADSAAGSQGGADISVPVLSKLEDMICTLETTVRRAAPAGTETTKYETLNADLVQLQRRKHEMEEELRALEKQVELRHKELQDSTVVPLAPPCGEAGGAGAGPRAAPAGGPGLVRPVAAATSLAATELRTLEARPSQPVLASEIADVERAAAAAAAAQAMLAALPSPRGPATTMTTVATSRSQALVQPPASEPRALVQGRPRSSSPATQPSFRGGLQEDRGSTTVLRAVSATVTSNLVPSVTVAVATSTASSQPKVPQLQLGAQLGTLPVELQTSVQPSPRTYRTITMGSRQPGFIPSMTAVQPHVLGIDSPPRSPQVRQIYPALTLPIPNRAFAVLP